MTATHEHQHAYLSLAFSAAHAHLSSNSPDWGATTATRTRRMDMPQQPLTAPAAPENGVSCRRSGPVPGPSNPLPVRTSANAHCLAPSHPPTYVDVRQCQLTPSASVIASLPNPPTSLERGPVAHSHSTFCRPCCPPVPEPHRLTVKSHIESHTSCGCHSCSTAPSTHQARTGHTRKLSSASQRHLRSVIRLRIHRVTRHSLKANQTRLHI